MKSPKQKFPVKWPSPDGSVCWYAKHRSPASSAESSMSFVLLTPRYAWIAGNDGARRSFALVSLRKSLRSVCVQRERKPLRNPSCPLGKAYIFPQMNVQLATSNSRILGFDQRHFLMKWSRSFSLKVILLSGNVTCLWFTCFEVPHAGMCCSPSGMIINRQCPSTRKYFALWRDTKPGVSAAALAGVLSISWNLVNLPTFVFIPHYDTEVGSKCPVNYW